MFFKTSEECRVISDRLDFDVEPNNLEIQWRKEQFPSITISYRNHNFTKTHALTKCIVSCLDHSSQTLLWITEYGIWRSSENLHLYYKIRQSYREIRSLQEAPGQVFLQHEQADLTTFLQLAVQFGWGGVLLGVGGEPYATFSHDELFVMYTKNIEVVAQAAERFGFPWESHSSVEVTCKHLQ